MPDINSAPISDTFAAPYEADDGKEVASSGVLSNVQDEHRAAEVTVIVSEITPNSDSALVGYQLWIQLEERVAAAPDVFVVRAVSDEWNTGYEKTHMISLRPGAVTNPGVHETRGTPENPIRIMFEEGVLPPYYRIRLMKKITNASRDDLASITFAAYLRTYQLMPSG